MKIKTYRSTQEQWEEYEKIMIKYNTFYPDNYFTYLKPNHDKNNNEFYFEREIDLPLSSHEKFPSYKKGEYRIMIGEEWVQRHDWKQEEYSFIFDYQDFLIEYDLQKMTVKIFDWFDRQPILSGKINQLQFQAILLEKVL